MPARDLYKIFQRLRKRKSGYKYLLIKRTRVYLKIALLLLLSASARAQRNVPDSLRQILTNTTEDSVRYNAGWSLYNYYEELNRDSALRYAELILSLAQKNGKKLPEVLALNFKAYQSLHLGRYATSLQCLLQAFKIDEDPKNEKKETWRLSNNPSPGKNRLLMLAFTHHIYGILMWQTQNIEQQIF